MAAHIAAGKLETLSRLNPAENVDGGAVLGELPADVLKELDEIERIAPGD